jgi:hypothetical protein
VNEPEKHHANNVWFHLHELSRIGQSIKTESRVIDTRDIHRNENWLLNGYRISFWSDDNILELERCESCTAL